MTGCVGRLSGCCATIVALALMAPTVVRAQEGGESAGLKVGDAAPPVKVEKFLRGQPVSQFEKGKVYVVEFWATWCGPCIASMPHLSSLQKLYGDKVTIIGTNIWEDRPEYSPETLKKVENFVKNAGDRMTYTVAFDGSAKAMDTAYMKAAGMNGIPTAFIVDKQGKIAWFGHPMWLDLPLDLIVNDKWDAKTGPERVAKAQQRLSEVFEKASDQPKEAVALWDEFEREYPALAHGLADRKFMLLLSVGEYKRAYELGAKLTEEAIGMKDAERLNTIAWTIVDPEGTVEKRDLDLAMKAAVKADEFSKHEDGAVIDTLARVHFLKGDLRKAIELQKQAVEKAPANLRPSLEKSLREYEAALAGKSA
jgi:thiol-disulfide isomerase/thioredoxin